MGPTSIGYSCFTRPVYCSVALSVKDSFEALSILFPYEESLDLAHMGVHEIALLLVHACLGRLACLHAWAGLLACLHAWACLLACLDFGPCPLFFFLSLSLGAFFL